MLFPSKTYTPFKEADDPVGYGANQRGTRCAFYVWAFFVRLSRETVRNVPNLNTLWSPEP